MASRSVTCYPIPGKPKASLTCEAFAAGIRAAGGDAKICREPPRSLEPGDAMFYGVRPQVKHLWEQAKHEKRTWWYCDNAYFDCAREKFFRVTRNGLQCDGINAVWNDEGKKRLAALGIQVKPWRDGGRHVLVCPQSDEFLRIFGGFDGDWTDQAVAALRRNTQREIRVRKKGQNRPLAADLVDAWAVVSHMSAALVEALLAGVPVFATGRCAAQWMGKSDLNDIENPLYPENREYWATILAANQFTVEEMRDGTAWRALNGDR